MAGFHCFKNATCLVTGASGFIGSRLVRVLVSSGAEVVAAVRPTSEPWRLDNIKETVDIKPYDLAESGHVREIVVSTKPDFVFNLAAYGVRYSEQDRNLLFRVNSICPSELMLAAAQLSIRRFVQIGSGFEFAPSNDRMDENARIEPVNLYGVSKAAASMTARGTAEEFDLRVSLVRPFSVYGPGEDERRFVPYVITSALRGMDVKITAGTQLRDYLYVDDLVDAIMRAAIMPTARFTSYNVGGNEQIAIKDLAKKIISLTGCPVHLEIGAVTIDRPEPTCFLADSTRAENELGWVPKYSLEAGINETIRWYRKR